MEQDNNLMEEDISVVSLTDEEGNEIDMELLDSIDYQGIEYLVLIPTEEEASEVVILEVEPHIDGTESYLSVEDEEILGAVFQLFRDRFQDFFSFED